jgi:hypothetical protein
LTFVDRGDGSPDVEHGDELCMALAAMLLQPHADGQRILSLPAWPTNWTADFLLATPHSTTVAAMQGRQGLRGGRPDGDAIRAQVQPIVIMPHMCAVKLTESVELDRDLCACFVRSVKWLKQTI